jgi:hypothetical protein
VRVSPRGKVGMAAAVSICAMADRYNRSIYRTNTASAWTVCPSYFHQNRKQFLSRKSSPPDKLKASCTLYAPHCPPTPSRGATATPGVHVDSDHRFPPNNSTDGADSRLDGLAQPDAVSSGERSSLFFSHSSSILDPKGTPTYLLV